MYIIDCFPLYFVYYIGMAMVGDKIGDSHSAPSIEPETVKIPLSQQPLSAIGKRTLFYCVDICGFTINAPPIIS